VLCGEKVREKWKNVEKDIYQPNRRRTEPMVIKLIFQGFYMANEQCGLKEKWMDVKFQM
jgi:hypothetical protein